MPLGGKAEHTGMCAARKANLVSGNLYRFASDWVTFFSVIGNKIIYQLRMRIFVWRKREVGWLVSRREGKWRDQGNKMTAEEHESEVRLSGLVECFSLAAFSCVAWVQMQTRWGMRFTQGCRIAKWVGRSQSGTKEGGSREVVYNDWPQNFTWARHEGRHHDDKGQKEKRWDQQRVDPGELKDSKSSGIRDSKPEGQKEESKSGVCEVEIRAGGWLLLMTKTKPGLSEWSRWEVQRTKRPRYQKDSWRARKIILSVEGTC